jgi:hypothetical protein
MLLFYLKSSLRLLAVGRRPDGGVCGCASGLAGELRTPMVAKKLNKEQM